jgi:hypothetical protein
LFKKCYKCCGISQKGNKIKFKLIKKLKIEKKRIDWVYKWRQKKFENYWLIIELDLVGRRMNEWMDNFFML